MMKRFGLLLTTLFFFAFTLPVKDNLGVRPKIQLAILLDTSSSMDGLINQAREQLWKIVNQLATAKQDGQVPDIEIALYEYGNSGLAAKENYIRQISPLTTDLDLISEKLFALTTNGGDEYCGAVIRHSVDNLNWDPSQKVLKIIFVAGNEPFTQGPVDFRESCKAAVVKDIIINTIHCGDIQTGIDGHWKEGALLGEGKYFCINTNARSVSIATPYDTTINRLNSELNKTYIGFRREARVARLRQIEQDANALHLTYSAARQRAFYKTNAQYNNASWDLVDAYAKDKKVLEKVEEEALPNPLQGLTKEELEEKIIELTEKRTRLKEELRHYRDLVRKYIAKERAKIAGKETNTLDHAILQAISEQAKKKNFEIKQ